MPTPNESDEKDSVVTCVFSNETPISVSRVLVLSELHEKVEANRPAKYQISSAGRIFKIEVHPGHYWEREESTSDDPFAFLASIARESDTTFKAVTSALSALQSSLCKSSDVVADLIVRNEKAARLIEGLLQSIDKLFSLNHIDRESLYSVSDLKQPKRGKSVREENLIIDQNVNHFLKAKKTYAALAYLRNRISSVRFGFPLQIDHGWFSESPEQVQLSTSSIAWFYPKNADNDIAGDILNKIAEHLFSLMNETGLSDPIADLYNTLSTYPGLRLKTDVLLRIITALIKNESVQLLETALNELKTREPQHPIIEEANRTIRRVRINAQIGSKTGGAVSSLQTMDGIEFEKFLEGRFQQLGFKVIRTKASGDFGADLIVETASGTRAAIQAKRFKQRVNLKAVQEVVASIRHYAVDFGIVITTSGFLQSAVDLAKTNDVELWDEDRLLRFLSGDFSFSTLSE